MTHDDFIEALAREGAPSPDALAHARECGECARILAAMTLAPEAPPAGYWEGFDARLRERLPVRAVARRRPRPAVRWVAWAAAVGGVLVLAGTWRHRRAAPESAALPRDAATVIAGLDDPAALERVLAEMAPGGLPETVLDAAPAADVGAQALDDSPGALEAELAATLDDDAQRDLARRLEDAS